MNVVATFTQGVLVSVLRIATEIIVGLFNLGSFAHAATSERSLEARLGTYEYIPLEYDVMYLVPVRA